jgi:DNA-binding response OmpR family regulator
MSTYAGELDMEIITLDENRPTLQEAKTTVLIVEDDAASREFLVELLSNWGYEAIAVGSAEEAEAAVQQMCWGAAVVDVFLPGKSGALLVSGLREKFPNSVLIATSAMGTSAMARNCKVQGADLFLQKPIHPEALAAALRATHQSWH